MKRLFRNGIPGRGGFWHNPTNMCTEGKKVSLTITGTGPSLHCANLNWQRAHPSEQGLDKVFGGVEVRGWGPEARRLGLGKGAKAWRDGTGIDNGRTYGRINARTDRRLDGGTHGGTSGNSPQ